MYETEFEYVYDETDLLLFLNINSSCVFCKVPWGPIQRMRGNIYMLPHIQMLHNSKTEIHSYADDTQLYISLSPSDYIQAQLLTECT